MLFGDMQQLPLAGSRTSPELPTAGGRFSDPPERSLSLLDSFGRPVTALSPKDPDGEVKVANGIEN